jgi:hypothetical protein
MRAIMRRAALGVAAVAVLALLAAPIVAFAQGDEPAPSEPSPATPTDCAERASLNAFPRMTAFVDDLVTDSVVTQEQADEIERRFREGAEYRCVAHLLFRKPGAIAVTADETGASRREVVRALRDGQSLAAFASEHGITVADLMASMMERPDERAAEFVAAGELSQEEANETLAEVERYIGELIDANGLREFRATRW